MLYGDRCLTLHDNLSKLYVFVWFAFIMRCILLYLPGISEQGQGLVEYALILALVSIVIVAVFLLLGPAIGNLYSKVVRAL